MPLTYSAPEPLRSPRGFVASGHTLEVPASPLAVSPEGLIERGEMWTTAVNHNQNLLGKTMLVLNRPCDSVTGIGPGEWSDLHRQITRVVVSLDLLFQPDLYNYAFLMNEDRQVHLHVIPRYRSSRSWDGHDFDDPHWGSSFGPEQRPLPKEQIRRLREAIKSRLPR